MKIFMSILSKSTALRLPFILLLCSLISCHQTTDEQKDTETHEHLKLSEEKSGAGTTESPQEDIPGETNISEALANKLLSSYLVMKEALVEADLDMVSAQASDMQAMLKNKELDEIGEGMADQLFLIGKEDDLEEMREEFEELSVHMYHLAKLVQSDQQLYWQHCPMAFGGEGANWLSKDKQIRNPYFGDKMLKCGKTVERL